MKIGTCVNRNEKVSNAIGYLSFMYQPLKTLTKTIAQQSERIETLHPERRKGVMINRIQYEAMRDFIISVMEKENEILFNKLLEKAHQNFQTDFRGNVAWCLLTVKLDLEARGIITNTFNFRQKRLQLLKFKKNKLGRIDF